MSRQLAFLAFLALSIAVPVSGISCHYGTTEIIDNRKFCTAFYFTDTGYAKFGGESSYPENLSTVLYRFQKEEDCKLLRGIKKKDGSARGYTLRPSYVPRNNDNESSAEA
ncbi:hypothetical protein GCK72_026024 [Caenorhabditis remanei]|uniref:Uncharacterized protein n=1 Tax=Caenorhabditis remanei TaxID=31234 RepID=A0A6A5G3R5_CAERE|nr:hypothetical protein GCK72_026024 [Caenorhabditis remanei]KAF1749556.1 hypothetical protein GCK72_026024 [Caenorhabditis remanei]